MAPPRPRRFGGQGWLWYVAERRLTRVVPPLQLPSVIGDLEEDYARRRATVGPIRARLWLVRESRSLARAYRAAAGPARLMLVDDLRHAWRRLAARPAAALLCAGLLALGIGLSTAMFSVVDSLLLQPAPFRDADRLIWQGLFRPEPAVMEAWRSAGIFEAVEAGSVATFRLDDDGGRTWPAALVTPGVFEMLGVRPIRGRVFGAVDTPDAVILPVRRAVARLARDLRQSKIQELHGARAPRVLGRSFQLSYAFRKSASGSVRIV